VIANTESRAVEKILATIATKAVPSIVLNVDFAVSVVTKLNRSNATACKGRVNAKAGIGPVGYIDDCAIGEIGNNGVGDGINQAKCSDRSIESTGEFALVLLNGIERRLERLRTLQQKRHPHDGFPTTEALHSGIPRFVMYELVSQSCCSLRYPHVHTGSATYRSLDCSLCCNFNSHHKLRFVCSDLYNPIRNKTLSCTIQIAIISSFISAILLPSNAHVTCRADPLRGPIRKQNDRGVKARVVPISRSTGSIWTR
jgi:hypothetical protein